MFDITATNRGKGAGLSDGSAHFTVSVPAGVDAASTVIVAAATFVTGGVSIPAGWTNLGPSTSGATRLHRFQRSSANGMTAGESSWVFTLGSASSLVAWIAWEQPGVDPEWQLAVDATTSSTTNTTAGTSASAGTTPATVGYDEGLFASFAMKESSATPATFTAYTTDWSEMDQVSATSAGVSITLAVAVRGVQQLGAYTCSATADQTLTATDAAAGHIVTHVAQGSRVAPDILQIEAAEQLTLVNTAPTGGLPDPVLMGAVTGNVVASTTAARSGGAGILVTAAAAAANYKTPECSTAGNWMPFTRHFRIPALPGARVRLWEIPPQVGGTSSLYVDIRSDNCLGVTFGSGTEVVSDQAVTANQWFGVDVRLDARIANTWFADWQVRYNAELSGGTAGVAQGRVASGGTTGSPVWSFAHIVGPTASATITFHTADAITGTQPVQYPLGDIRTKLLMLDATATPTVVGTVGNFALITNNATGTTLTTGAPLATARDNLREGPPPTIGATQNGVCQIAVATGDYLQFPLQTADWAALGLVPRGVRVLGAGWSATSSAATIALTAWDGTTEYGVATTISTAASDVGFTASTTAPTWLAGMLRTQLNKRVDWTPAKVNALSLRIGKSSDATPDRGFLWAAAIVAATPVVTQGLFGDLTTAEADSDSAGVQRLIVTPTEGQDADLYYEESGSPTTVPAVGGTTVTEVVQAPDAPTTNYIALYPDPEGVADS